MAGDGEAVRYSDVELMLVAQVLQSSGHGGVTADVVRSWFAHEEPIPDDIYDQLRAVIAELPRLILRARGQLAKDPRWLAANLYEHLQEDPAERRAKADPKNRMAMGWQTTHAFLRLPPKCIDELDLVWRVSGYRCRSDFYAVLVEMYWRGMREKFIEQEQERRLQAGGKKLTEKELRQKNARYHLDTLVRKRWPLFARKLQRRTSADQKMADALVEAPAPGWVPTEEQVKEAKKRGPQPRTQPPYKGKKRGRKPKAWGGDTS